MAQLAMALFGTGMGLIVYVYAVYPTLLRILGTGRGSSGPLPEPDPWPTVSVSLPAYNEEHQIAATLESLVSLDYPRNRLQILVVSDASSDRTDDIVRAYADRGVALLRIPERRGREAADAAAASHLTGEIVIKTDASIRLAPDALRSLIRPFADREVGLAAGRNISVATGATRADEGGARSYGFEIVLRDLETRIGSIVDPSGCFYAIRNHLHRIPLPTSLDRDFAAALHCRERGYRAISVPEAISYAPGVWSPGRDYRRQVHAIAREMRTLTHKRHLMNPFRYGLFSWMLFSHKVCRWLVPWASVLALAGLALLAPSTPWARLVLFPAFAALLMGAVGWLAATRNPPRLLLGSAARLVGSVAAMQALFRAMRGDTDLLWDPTWTAPAPGE